MVRWIIARLKNLFYAISWKVVCLRIGVVGQNIQVLGSVCIPEENSLETQKVVKSQWYVCTVLLRNKACVDSFSYLFKSSLSDRVPLFNLFYSWRD